MKNICTYISHRQMGIAFLRAIMAVHGFIEPRDAVYHAKKFAAKLHSALWDLAVAGTIDADDQEDAERAAVACLEGLIATRKYSGNNEKMDEAVNTAITHAVEFVQFHRIY